MKNSRLNRDLYKPVMRENLLKWRREPATVRLERPTKLDRARTLGYRAKQGIIVVRQRLERNSRKRERFAGGRRSKHNRRLEIIHFSHRAIAEQRVNKKFPNMEVLNSYPVGEDGNYKWFEVIMVDKNHPQIKKDKNLKWITSNKHTRRAFRGLTSAAKKSSMYAKKKQ